MRVAIHQPNFLPWMGYFYKMAQCDAFVLLDHVEFTKRSYTKRVLIHNKDDMNQDQYLMIPLQKHSDHIAIKDLKITNDSKWQDKIKAQIHQTYHKAPFYNQLEPLMDSFLVNPPKSDSFSDFTIALIKFIAQTLNLNPTWVVSSHLDIEYTPKNINIDILSHLNADTYISGMGAKKYQDEEAFKTKEISLKYSDYKSYFENLHLPHHFLNKSIISYLAHYDLEFLHEMLHKASNN